MKTAALRIALVAGCAGMLVIIGLVAPLLFRRSDAFDVQRVEIVGARHLDVRSAVGAAGIRGDASVFSDEAEWLRGLLEHPLVVDARIERRVPHTIVLHITESTPIAFARTPELRPIDYRGRVLPIDPIGIDLDLPVLLTRTRLSAGDRVADAETLRLAAFLDQLHRVEPGLLDWVSEAGVIADDVRLVLRTARDTEVLLPAEVAPERLRELHYTLAALASARPVAARQATTGERRSERAELSRVRHIDVRFHDQIVVAMDEGTN
jgi:hypothetical protein